MAPSDSDAASQLSEKTVNNEQERTPRVNAICRRIHGWSWQAFPVGMGTGAVYVILHGLKDRSPVIATVETVFYFLNMALFLLNTTTLLLQAILYPRQAYRLLTDPVKGIFVPLIVLSFATIIIGTINYAVPTHHVGPDFVYALFWIYVGFAVLTCFPMMMIWFNKPHDLAHFTPAYAFLVFPMMLVGVVAFNVLRVLTPEDSRSLGVLLIGYFFQGIGFFMTFFYICIYIIRIIMTGFLRGHQANGAFIACGPPGFTALALIKLGRQAREILAHNKLVSPMAGEIWYAGSVMASLLLFGLAVFFFLFGAMPWWFKVHKSMKEILGCWALTFPNVGWIATIRELADIFNLPGFHVLHIIMAVLMCITWVVLFVLTVVAFFQGHIFKSMPEDVIKDSFLHRHEEGETPIV
ncbi:hypothetical protein P691DRAFT_700995 [Macrolepiota fuliginosa MF-IS2]|uniref:C4-dicarboxylate transporter/malic acid transport protein n=1 Tax=Macrolepiota fuliginosa MF-IS2 TaxID=1400762 RepID=A0A9P5XHS0_9AGAR|nr:hypothetical protein P691DRAFT_700995 [Macrolepiota fuliginosa MF-IS2]